MSYNFSGPRMSQMNGNNRRPTNLNRLPPLSHERQPTYSQHDDLIKYMCDSWNKVSQEADRNQTTKFYTESENHNLRGFEPFDLDRFWDKKGAPNYQQSHHS